MYRYTIVLLFSFRNLLIICAVSLKVMVAVEEITKDKKVITLKMRRRKASRNLKGHRRQVVILRIKDILVSEETATDMGM